MWWFLSVTVISLTMWDFWSGATYLNDVGDIVDQLVQRIEILEENSGGNNLIPSTPDEIIADLEDAFGDLIDYAGDINVDIRPTGPNSVMVYVMSHINMEGREYLNMAIILAAYLGRDIRILEVQHMTGSHFVVHVGNVEIMYW